MFTPRTPVPERVKDSLSVELGSWFKAYATGVGVLAIPIIVLALAAVALLDAWLH